MKSFIPNFTANWAATNRQHCLYCHITDRG